MSSFIRRTRVRIWSDRRFAPSGLPASWGGERRPSARRRRTSVSCATVGSPRRAATAARSRILRACPQRCPRNGPAATPRTTRRAPWNGASTATWRRAHGRWPRTPGFGGRVATGPHSYLIGAARFYGRRSFAMPPNMPPDEPCCPRRSDRQAGLPSCTSSRARYPTRHMPRGLVWFGLARLGSVWRGGAWHGVAWDPRACARGSFRLARQIRLRFCRREKSAGRRGLRPEASSDPTAPSPPRAFCGRVAGAGGGPARGMAPSKPQPATRLAQNESPLGLARIRGSARSHAERPGRTRRRTRNGTGPERAHRKCGDQGVGGCSRLGVSATRVLPPLKPAVQAGGMRSAGRSRTR